ncbi:hypothetical protein J2741_001815 [Methanolinea mesophila]|uniref:PEGA domain-containing protein n=1 Tax=Methanolinea mesophila TaxID=547055 RepID=UPI001AE9D6CB|nr:PEGA domain-containing protein [Methanolinea mesophila]MBP1929268.1 hypothetical protein [Methanolinea mesophila]
MKSCDITARIGISLIFVCALISGGFVVPASAADLYATIGDTIPLNGTALLVDTVYMYMTGPGVPANGARMDNSNAAVITGDPSTFTQVPVNDDTWVFSWNTGRVTGGLAEGIYTVYVATAPAAANDLSGVKYSDIQIALKKAVTTGSLAISSSPVDAQVSLNGRYVGNTPLTATDLAPGEYRVLLELQGYQSAEGDVSVAAGQTATYSASLEPIVTTGTSISGTTPVTPSPPATSPVTSPSPTTAPIPWILAILSIGLVILGRSSGKT